MNTLTYVDLIYFKDVYRPQIFQGYTDEQLTYYLEKANEIIGLLIDNIYFDFEKAEEWQRWNVQRATCILCEHWIKQGNNLSLNSITASIGSLSGGNSPAQPEYVPWIVMELLEKARARSIVENFSMAMPGKIFIKDVTLPPSGGYGKFKTGESLSETSIITNDLNNDLALITKEYFETNSSGNVDLSNYYDKTEIDGKIDLINDDISAINTDLANETLERTNEDNIIYQNIDTINTNLIATNTKIDNEKQSRIDADVILQNNIDNIVTLDPTNYYVKEEVDTLISNEESARTSADDLLEANISDEETNRTNADNLIQTNVDNEVLARIDGDDTLQQNITLEEEERINGDTQLQSQMDGKLNISNEGISFFGTNYNNEQESKITVASFGPNQSTIDFTVNNKSLQFSELEDGRVWFVSLNTLDKGSPQAFAQMKEINDLQSQIDGIGFDPVNYYDKSEVDTLISNETNERTSADDLLQTNITSEETARIDGDNNLIITTNLLNIKIDDETTERINTDNILQGNIETVALSIIQNKTESNTSISTGTFPNNNVTRGVINNFNFASYTGTYYDVSGSSIILKQNADTFDVGIKMTINNAQNTKAVELLVNGTTYESKSVIPLNNQTVLFNVTMKNVVAATYLMQFRIENVGGNFGITSAPTNIFAYNTVGSTGSTTLNSSQVIDNHLTVVDTGINTWMNQIDSGKIEAFDGVNYLNNIYFTGGGNGVYPKNFTNNALTTIEKGGVAAINELNTRVTTLENTGGGSYSETILLAEIGISNDETKTLLQPITNFKQLIFITRTNAVDSNHQSVFWPVSRIAFGSNYMMNVRSGSTNYVNLHFVDVSNIFIDTSTGNDGNLLEVVGVNY